MDRDTMRALLDLVGEGCCCCCDEEDGGTPARSRAGLPPLEQHLRPPSSPGSSPHTGRTEMPPLRLRPVIDEPFVPPPKLDLAPLPLPGAGVVAAVGAIAPSLTLRASGELRDPPAPGEYPWTGYRYVQNWFPAPRSADHAALAALQARGFPLPVQMDAPAAPLHLRPEVVASTLDGGTLLILYAAAWGGILPNGGSRPPGGPPAYVLVRLNPLTAEASVVDVHEVSPPVPTPRTYPGDGGEWSAWGPAHRAHDSPSPDPIFQAHAADLLRHVVLSARPGRIRGLGILTYLRDTPDGVETWRGVLTLTATAGGITTQVTPVPEPPEGDADLFPAVARGTPVHLGATGELPDGRLAWVQTGRTQHSIDDAALDLVAWDGEEGRLSLLASWAPGPASDRLYRDFVATRQSDGSWFRNGVGVDARHHQQISPGEAVTVLVNTRDEGVKMVRPDDAGGPGVVLDTGHSNVYPGWPRGPLTGGRLPLSRWAMPQPVTLARAARLRLAEGDRGSTLRVILAGGGHLFRLGDRVTTPAGVLDVTGASEFALELGAATSLSWPAGTVLTPERLTTSAPWSGHGQPAQLPQPEPGWLPPARFLPATISGARKIRPLPDTDPDVPHRDLRRPSLAVRNSLEVTWPQTPPDYLSVHVLVVTVRLSRPGTLTVTAAGGPHVWSSAHEITHGRRWVQIRTPASYDDSTGAPPTTLYADQPFEVSSLLVERLGQETHHANP